MEHLGLHSLVPRSRSKLSLPDARRDGEGQVWVADQVGYCFLDYRGASTGLLRCLEVCYRRFKGG